MTVSKSIVISALGICSGSLSTIGSGIIVFKILRDRGINGITTSYDRFILGLSTCDTFASIIYAIDQFLFPVGRTPWSIGNPATCQAIGFLYQFFVASSWWYSGLLSSFFFLTVLSQVRRKKYVRTFEPWMHTTVAFFPITAVVGLFRGWFGESALNCYIADQTIKWILVKIPLYATVLMVIVNYSAIYAIVRKSVKSPEPVVAGPQMARKRIQKEASVLMILYVASFVLCVSPIIVTEAFEYFLGRSRFESNAFYAVRVLYATVMPLQGFFNFFIYTRPAYKRFRVANPTKSASFVMHQALFNPRIPSLHSGPRVANHTTHASCVGLTDGSLGEDSAIHSNQELFEESSAFWSRCAEGNATEDEANIHTNEDPECGKEEP